MRVLFVLIVLANVWVYTMGQGWVGSRPGDVGRDQGRNNQELNAGRVTVGR